MGQDHDNDSRNDRSEDTGPFAREEELRYQSEQEPLGGCDIEHCQRMYE